MSTDVQRFQHNNPGAPANDGTVAGLIAILDYCLINGGSTVAIATMSESGGLVTATVSAGHGLLAQQVALIAGANESAFNGRKKITITDSTTFTFPASAGESGTATGTITVQCAPVGGWQKIYTATNVAVYRSTDPAAHNGGYYLQISAENGSVAKWRGYQSMTDANTGTGATDLFYAWITSANGWSVYADQRAIWYFADFNAAFFGDLIRFDLTDIGATLVGGRHSNSTTAAAPYTEWIMPGYTRARLISDKSGGATNDPARLSGIHFANKYNTNEHAPGISSANSPLTLSGNVGVRAHAGPPCVADGVTLRGWLPGVGLPFEQWTGSIPSFVDDQGHTWLYQLMRAGALGVGYVGALWINLTGPWR